MLVVHKIDRFSRKLRVTLEHFEKLGKAGVGFVAIENQIDYSTPMGKLMLNMQGGLAELYSDNLSEEVKKGLTEREARGLHCGPLPFGATINGDKVPIPDPASYSGLLLAFELGAQGMSDREVAQRLNADGYWTTGARGDGRFSVASIRGILTNRFYLGELADGDKWINGKHESMVDQAL